MVGRKDPCRLWGWGGDQEQVGLELPLAERLEFRDAEGSGGGGPLGLFTR